VAAQRRPKKSSPVVKAVPPPKPQVEQFIGHDSETMVGDESFAEFEARTNSRESATAPVPVHVPSPAKPPSTGRPGPPVPTQDEEPGGALVPEDEDDGLPDELED
jgi:hypothetical protein